MTNYIPPPGGLQSTTSTTTKRTTSNPEAHKSKELNVVDIADPNSLNFQIMRFLPQHIQERIINTFNESIPLYKNGLVKALSIHTERDVQTFLDTFMYKIDELNGKDNKEAFIHDLALLAGYFDVEVRMRIERLFDCEHPWFGKCVDKPDWNKLDLIRKAANILEQYGILDSKINQIVKEKLDSNLKHHSNKIRRRAQKLIDKYYKWEDYS